MNSPRRRLLKSTLLLALSSLGSAAEASKTDDARTPKPENVDPLMPDHGVDGDVSKQRRNFKELRAAIPWVHKWWTFKFRDVTFTVCYQEPPSSGNSRDSVHIWKNVKDRFVDHVFSFCSAGIGALETVIDAVEGTVVIRGVANTSLKGKTVATVLLAACLG